MKWANHSMQIDRMPIACYSEFYLCAILGLF
jgi:hypothetical protein